MWRTLYDTFPRLLIIFAVREVETFNRRLELIEDVLFQLQTRGSPYIEDVKVYATTQALMQQHGPLAKIWFNCLYGAVHTSAEDTFFAFDGLQEMGIETEMPALMRS
jgi:hypothetical protein